MPFLRRPAGFGRLLAKPQAAYFSLLIPRARIRLCRFVRSMPITRGTDQCENEPRLAESTIVRTVTLFIMGLVACVFRWPDAGERADQECSNTGRVMDATGTPIANAAVKVKVPFGQNIAITRTDENGSFKFPAIFPQQYELSFESLGFRRLTVPVNLQDSSSRIDMATVVLEVAPVEDPSNPLIDHVTAPYEPSILPNWLKSDPGANVPFQPTGGGREETTASRWQTASCSKVNRSGRRIVSMNRIVEFYVPPSAHLNKTTDADYVEYHVQYGPSLEKVWLNFMFGPMVGGYSTHDVQGETIRWTSRKWQCNVIEGSDVRGVSSDGRGWRYINIPTSGFAAYEGVAAKAADYLDGILDSMCCGKRPF
ncbi:MAG: hypothetical protein DMG58_19040 [Acidobacteria bacterium]|nr:MAG: hypothetical protein DMG58_19040 [Acidobacteriota bacterium]